MSHEREMWFVDERDVVCGGVLALSYSCPLHIVLIRTAPFKLLTDCM